MKCYTPEIAWHNREPVLSVDLHPTPVSDSVFRIASGGVDQHVLIWHITHNTNETDKCIPEMKVVADLTRHQKTVNIVRFSPSGEFLASGDDDSLILIWRRKESVDKWDVGSNNEEYEESWTSDKKLKSHLEDVYDLCWSSDSTQLISGSVDNTAILWNVKTGTKITTLSDHRGFVQGVSWDPLEKYVATLGCDRTLRVYSLVTKNVIAKCSKATLPRSKITENPIGRIFHDDSLKTYFRRLTFSPDGLFLIVPSGIIEPLPIPTNTNPTAIEIPIKPINATYVFMRDSFTAPIMYYPSADEYTVAVRCCPTFFKKKNSNSGNDIFNIPYRIIIAVATKSSILLYDTEHTVPFGYITDIHYTRLTDLSWSTDGRMLITSSTDGYCTIVNFQKDELGEPWTDNTKELTHENNDQNDTSCNTDSHR